eukprot:XP_001700688.1 predicted protein [Chlamydomonas reinhardtii]
MSNVQPLQTSLILCAAKNPRLSHHLGLVHTFTEGSCGYDADQPTGVSDTPSASGPVWSMPWSLNAYKASVRLGIPPGDQTPGFDSCPDRPGSDETANYITYSYPICYVSLGHFTSSQVATLHRICADANPTLYQWAQYYAINPPAAARCTCLPSWKSGGTTYSDCVTTPGGQATATGTSWDYCPDACNPTTTTTGGTSSGAGGSSSGPAPSPAAAPSYPLRKDCGARAVTGLPTGCSCADSYNIGFDGRGICITTCTAGNKAANRKPYACDCAAA